MATHEVQAVRDQGVWQVFIDGFLVTEVTRWPSVAFVAREWIGLTEEVPPRTVDLRVRVVGRNQYIDAV
jgi:hypothetical protein